ncbi:hypothetical protein B0H16DRAFT_1899071 [Mycena metata]|uniref:Uncharacterized protein n=1 Tax=Mycena metata TaxID=1033252 RepID=A0AAD7H7R4_9AGAR|nr:hypothetical protein B0H16DRAFT_1899071 [Mycena metata]
MATNMVPAIASTALPATPADEWADGMNEFIGTHVTRTPVGTPGPAVPGAFPAHLESESNSSTPKITAANAQEQASALLASAQSYLPSLEQAKAYLPQGVAAYLPSSPAQSPPTASAPVDVGHATTVPYTESAPEPYRQDTNSSSTVNVGHGATVPYTESAPEPYRQDTNSSSTVNVGHGATVPYTESAPEPYRQDTNSSSTVNVGHGATVPYTESAPEPYSQPQSAAQSQTSFATSTHSGPGLAGVGAGLSPSSPTHSTTAHTGHAASATGVPPPASGLLPSHPGVGGDDAPTPSPALGPPGPPSPAVVQSPAPLEPRASTELALAAEHPVSSPLPGAVGVNAGRPRPAEGLLASHPGVASSSNSTAGRPTPNPDLLPSHPAAGPQPHVHAYPAHTYDSASSTSTSTTPAATAYGENVHAHATQALDAAGARHPTPHAVPLPSSSIDSGYAASSESGLVSPPAPPAASSNNGATFPPFVGDLGLSSPHLQSTHGQAVQGSAALNSSRLADVLPTGTDDSHSGGSAALNSGRLADVVPTGTPSDARSRTREGGVPTGDFDYAPHHEHASAAQHGQAHGENAHGQGGRGMVPTGDPPSTEYNTSSTPHTSAAAASTPEEDGDTSGSGSGGEHDGGDGKPEGAWGGKGKGRKGKLLQRLKEKMHVGGSN